MKQHRYRITLEHIADSDNVLQDKQPLVFEAKCHDEIFGIVDQACKRELMNTSTTTALVVGQKLFGEVVLEHRNSPLFSEFFPHFTTFMKGFKRQVKQL